MLDKRSTESEWEPVDELSDGDKANAKAKSANPSQVGDEVQPGHFWSSLELWEINKSEWALWKVGYNEELGL